MNLKAGGRGGLIVNVSSVAGIDCVQFSSPVYNATKHGVVAFTRSMGVSEFSFVDYFVCLSSTKVKSVQDKNSLRSNSFLFSF